MHNRKRNQKLLVATVLAALLAMPAYGHAFERKPEYVKYNGKPMAELQILNKGEGLTDEDGEVIVEKAGYTLKAPLIKAIKSSTAYWTEMIGPKSKNGQPWQIFVTTEKNLQNASANTTSFYVKNRDAVNDADNYVAKLFQDGKKLVRLTEKTAETAPKGDYTFSTITIGQFFGGLRKGAVDGWWVDTDTVLPSNEQATDFVGTFRHELGHALGIMKVNDFLDAKDRPYVPESEEDVYVYPQTREQKIAFSKKLDDAKSWNMHLVDQNLNPTKPGMRIVSSTVFKALKKKGYFP